MGPVGQSLWFANAAALAILVVRLATTQLQKIYRYLFAYFLIELSASVILTQFPVHTNSYAYGYMAYTGVTHIAAIAVVLEIYRVALASQPGLARFGRASLVTVIVFASLIAAVDTLLDKDILSGQSTALHRFFTLERTLDLIILVFLLLMTIFMTWFPIQLSRNTAISIGGFLVFYFTRAAGLLAVNLLPAARFAFMDNVLLGISFAILIAWAAALREERLSPGFVPGHAWDPLALDRVGRQLDAINSVLVRLGRR